MQHTPFKIPTIAGLFLVIALIGGVSFFFERSVRQVSLASPTTTPTDIVTTNIADSLFTVTWFTADPATGAIMIRADNQKTITVFDDRDMDAKTDKKTLGKYTTHTATARNLVANTDYAVTILTNGKPYQDPNKPIIVHTGPTLPVSASTLEPAFGTVMTADNKPATDALVFLTLPGSQMLSTVIKSSGNWVLSLSQIRTDNHQYYVTIPERTDEQIRIMLNGMESKATTDTLNDAPVPTMILGKIYDFRKQQASVTQKQTDVLGASSVQNFSFSLMQPKDNAILTTNRPLVQGTGIPGKSVTITLGISHPTSNTTTVGGDGIWRYSPTLSLEAGKQSVTATSIDNSSKPIALTHTFIVQKSGTQVLGDATPSATLTPTTTLMLSPTPTIYIDPTASVTPEASLTGQPVPTSGSGLPTILLIILGVGLLITGGLLVI